MSPSWSASHPAHVRGGQREVVQHGRRTAGGGGKVGRASQRPVSAIGPPLSHWSRPCGPPGWRCAPTRGMPAGTESFHHTGAQGLPAVPLSKVTVQLPLGLVSITVEPGGIAVGAGLVSDRDHAQRRAVGAAVFHDARAGTADLCQRLLSRSGITPRVSPENWVGRSRRDGAVGLVLTSPPLP